MLKLKEGFVQVENDGSKGEEYVRWWGPSHDLMCSRIVEYDVGEFIAFSCDGSCADRSEPFDSAEQAHEWLVESGYESPFEGSV